MKVIVAGMPKTGTKSMKAALMELGYNVYDYREHIYIHGQEWRKIFSEGATTEEFRRMYENVDAVTDIPACYFWDEIHKAFPDSKIILTVRDNEDEWMNSFRHQIKAETEFHLMLMRYFSPTMRPLCLFIDDIYTVAFGTKVEGSLFRKGRCNELLLRMTYRRHNSHVMQTAPKDKLLIFKVTEGWEPLCKFLVKDVPNKPFPRKNVKGEVMKEVMENDPIFAKCRREVIVSVFSISLAVGFGGFKLFKYFMNNFDA